MRRTFRKKRRMDLLHKEALMAMESRKRATLINKISGFKPANLLATQGASGKQNLALFNSVVHIGANPPYLGFILRPTTVPRHTYENLIETGFYTINAVTTALHARAHQTSGKFGKEESEFEACGLKPVYHGGFPAPFVSGSPIGIGMRFEEELLVQSNGTRLIVGAVECLVLAEEAMEADGDVSLDGLDLTAIGGLDTYYRCERIGRYAYFRPGEALKRLDP